MDMKAQYFKLPGSSSLSGIRIEINGVLTFVPLDPANVEYRRIMALVETGELVIADPEVTP